MPPHQRRARACCVPCLFVSVAWCISFHTACCVTCPRAILQGIGSDASYNPASGGYGGGGAVGPGGMNTEDIGGQIGQMGQKSMRFLSESFANLQTGVKVNSQETLNDKAPVFVPSTFCFLLLFFAFAFYCCLWIFFVRWCDATRRVFFFFFFLDVRSCTTTVPWWIKEGCRRREFCRGLVLSAPAFCCGVVAWTA